VREVDAVHDVDYLVLDGPEGVVLLCGHRNRVNHLDEVVKRNRQTSCTLGFLAGVLSAT
jgi:hypothetical protein